MPPEPVEMRKGLALWLRESFLAPELVLSQACSQALPQGCLDDRATAACVSQQCFGWEGTLGTAKDQAGLAEGCRFIPWVFQREQALRQKPAILPKLYRFCILCCFSL